MLWANPAFSPLATLALRRSQNEMNTVYGTVAWCASPNEVEGAVQRMLTALAAYPWCDGGLQPLTVHEGSGALAQQNAGERGRLPAGSPYSLGRLTVAADIRLDNRAELLATLGIDRIEGRTLSDSALLLHAYQRWGVDCPIHLLGDFAFALWDAERQRLFCSRDVVGVRPFYYYHQTGRAFVLASNLQALLAQPMVPRQLNLAYIKAELLTELSQFQHPTHTFYSDVTKLPPAHCLTVEHTGLRQWAYWQPGQKPERRYASEGDYVEEVQALLHQAVACRVQETVHPVGAHLSGGLDSSSLAVIAQRILQERGRTVTGFSWAPPFTVLPSTQADDERRLAETVATTAGLPLCYTTLTVDHILEYAQRDITTQPTTTLQLELAASREASAHGVRTILSGWGGDELLVFNGRGYFADLLRRGRWRTLHRELTQRGELHGAGVWRQWITLGLFPLLPRRLLRRLRPADFPPPLALPASLQPAFAALLATVEPLPQGDLHERPGVRRMQLALLNYGHIRYRLESWAAHGATLGITYAFPLLDRRIIEFALSIPDELYFKHGWKRYLYRTSLAGILPDPVRWHKVKRDPAMVGQLRQVSKTASAPLQAALRARADNPFIDVEQLIAAQARNAAVTARNLPIDQQFVQQRAAARGQWLAFVDPAGLAAPG